jgi:hypothetical protein
MDKSKTCATHENVHTALRHTFTITSCELNARLSDSSLTKAIFGVETGASIAVLTPRA